jgi:hypothetical protein
VKFKKHAVAMSAIEQVINQTDNTAAQIAEHAYEL